MKQSQSILVALAAAGALFVSSCDGNGGGGGGDGISTPTVTGTTSSAGGATSLDEYVKLIFTEAFLDGPQEPVEVWADPDGNFSADLLPGFYDLLAERPGYEDFESFGIEIARGVTTTLDIAMVALPAGEYVGSTDCGVCHASQYDTFKRSGHPFKLSKVENGEVPTFPFTSLDGALELVSDDDSDLADPHAGTDNTLGTPLSYDEVSYVIGGYAWKARFVDLDGFIVTGSKVQYNYFTGDTAGYHDNEVDKAYNCGNCHTTGWRHYDPNLNGQQQDGLMGMDGTFAMDGVHCEACHGAGSTHSQTMNRAFITQNAKARSTDDLKEPDAGFGMPVACGECHTRDGERDYDTYLSGFDNARMDAGMPAMPMGGRVLAKGGMIRHHEQYDEILGIDPDDPALESTRSAAFMEAHGNCSACHDPHTTTVFQDISGDPPGVRTSCTECHADRKQVGSHTGFACEACHMPLLAKSATLTFDPPPGDDRPPQGDVASHLFRIDLLTDDQFTDDGKYAYPWITARNACERCHSESGVSFPLPSPWLTKLHR